MNKIRPYLFWIVCGVIVLAEVIVGLIVVPMDGERTPTEVKAALDAESGSLQSLHQRARKGEPTREFDPRSDVDIKELTEEYIITPQWTNTVNACVSGYERMLADIKAYLIECSAPLADKIMDTPDKNVWMDKYGEFADKLVKSIKGARVIVAADDTQTLDALGLFDVKSGGVPQPSQHKDLTAQFRIVDQIAQIVMKTRGKAIANPVASDKPEPEEAAAEAGLATIVRIGWTPNTAENLDGQIAPYAVHYHLTLRLTGSEPVLMAILSEIDSIAAPVYVVSGATMSQASVAVGAKRTVIPIDLTVDISVIDFNKAAEPAPESAGGAP
jgi:hypothetical protein